MFLFKPDSFSEIKNSMHNAQKRTDLFSIEQIYFFVVLSIMQKRNCRKWERMNTSSYTSSLNWATSSLHQNQVEITKTQYNQVQFPLFLKPTRT